MLSALRRERLLRQLTLYDVRARTGISVSKLSLVERGFEEANNEEKRRLSRALGVRPADIFPAKKATRG